MFELNQFWKASAVVKTRVMRLAIRVSAVLDWALLQNGFAALVLAAVIVMFFYQHLLGIVSFHWDFAEGYHAPHCLHRRELAARPMAVIGSAANRSACRST